jgi:DHA2 family multidrug resistance protein
LDASLARPYDRRMPFPRLASQSTIPTRRRAQRHARVAIDVSRTGSVARIALLAVSLLCMFADQTATIGFGTVTPYVRGTLAVDPDAAAWLTVLGGAGYMIGVVFSPRLVERFGRRRTFFWAAGAFMLFTALCSWASTYGAFLVVHTLAQIFEGLTYAASVILMCILYPRMMWGYSFITFALSALVGQYLGTLVAGLCVDQASSTAFFLITALVIGISIAIAALTFPSHEPPVRAVPFDTVGAAVFATAALAMQYLSVQGERYSWFDEPHIIFVASALAVALAGLALWMYYGTRHPLFDWRVLLTRNHVIGDVLAVVNGFFGYASTLFVIYLESSLGFTPTLAGEMLAFRLIILVATVVAVGFLHARRILDNRISLTAALVIVAIAFWRLSFEMTATADFSSFLFDSALLSIGLGIITLTPPGLVFGPLTNARIASGTVFYKMSSVTGALIGAAVGSTLLDHRIAVRTSELASTVTLSSPAVAQIVAHHGASQLATLVAQQARTAAYADVMRMFSLVALIALPLIAVIRPAFQAQIAPATLLRPFLRFPFRTRISTRPSVATATRHIAAEPMLLPDP